MEIVDWKYQCVKFTLKQSIFTQAAIFDWENLSNSFEIVEILGAEWKVLKTVFVTLI